MYVDQNRLNRIKVNQNPASIHSIHFLLKSIVTNDDRRCDESNRLDLMSKYIMYFLIIAGI